MKKVLKTFRHINEIFDNDRLDWEVKYHMIFSLCPKMTKRLGEVGLRLDYYDPDTTYEEDVTALRKMLESYPALKV